MHLTTQQLKNLTDDLTLPRGLLPGFNHPVSSYFFWLKKLLIEQTLILRVINAGLDILKRNFSDLAKDREILRKSSDRLSKVSSKAGLDSHLFGSDFGYQNEDKDVDAWLLYRRYLKQKPDFGESPVVYQESINRCSDFLSDGSDGVINFGVCYAYLDATLARNFPQKKFIGIERSSLVQALNRHEFDGISNLEFVTDDIFKFLESRELQNYVLLHSRILTFLSPDFVKNLYEKSRKVGIRKIVGVEPYGISRLSWRTPELSYEPRPSEAFRAGMFLHNYPNFLDSAGFNCTSAEMLKTSHNHPDYRLLCYSAQLE